MHASRKHLVWDIGRVGFSAVAAQDNTNRNKNVFVTLFHHNRV